MHADPEQRRWNHVCRERPNAKELCIGCEDIRASVSSHFSHLAWTHVSCKECGLGPMNILLMSDLKHSISRDYGILKEEDGVVNSSLIIIDCKEILHQITINDLPVGCSVDEVLHLVHWQAWRGLPCQDGDLEAAPSSPMWRTVMNTSLQITPLLKMWLSPVTKGPPICTDFVVFMLTHHLSMFWRQNTLFFHLK